MKRLMQRLLSLLALLSAELLLLWGAFFFCLLLFGMMVHTVFLARDTALDQALFRFADSHTSPRITRLMIGISFLASVEYLLVVPPLVVLGLSFYRKLRWYALKVLLISFSSSVLNQVMKRFFGRPRPDMALLEQTGLSFPSGHAMIGGAFYGLLIYLVWRTVGHVFWRWALTLLLTALLLLIGYSRIYLKVHYATDVLAGYAIGLLWLLVSVRLMGRLEKVYVDKFARRQA